MTNFIFLISQLLSKFFMLIFYVLLPRFIGLEEYGKFSYTFALCSITAQPIIELGLDLIITKWVSRGIEDILKKAFIIRIFSSILAIILNCISSLIFHTCLPLTLLFTFYLIFLVFSNTIFSFFRGKEIFIYEIFLLPVGKIGVLIILFILYFLHIRSAFLGGFSLFFSSFLVCIILVVILTKYHLPFSSTYMKGPSYKEFLKEGITLFFTTILWIVYFKIDTLMLGLMINTKEVGLYNTAYKLIEGTFVLPSIIMTLTYPKLSKQKKILSLFLKTFLIMLIIGIVCSIVIHFFSDFVIINLYGKKFKKSAEFLKILSFVIIPVFIGHLTTQSFVALDKSKLYLLITLISTFLNVILNWIFIPHWQGFGAVYATIATESFVTIITGVYIWEHIKKMFSK